MLKVDEIQNGVVIDHITAGTGLALYHMMELEKLNNASVALLQNVRSQKDGKKDIIKIEGDVSEMSFDVLAYVDPKISITFIRNGRVTEKKHPEQPKRLVNVIKCTNPRCITSIEEGCDHIFALTPSGRYRCIYCEQEFRVNRKRGNTMEKPKFHLNPNEEIVKTIREGLKRTGGYCPCRLPAHSGEYLHLQGVQGAAGRPGLPRGVPLRAVCEGLRIFPFYNNYNKQ